MILDHQQDLSNEWKVRHKFLARAKEISNEWRVINGMITLDEETSRIIYNDSMPQEFQPILNRAHNFNKYLKELRERYIQ
jgi:hypothetical protein